MATRLRPSRGQRLLSQSFALLGLVALGACAADSSEPDPIVGTWQGGGCVSSITYTLRLKPAFTGSLTREGMACSAGDVLSTYRLSVQWSRTSDHLYRLVLTCADYYCCEPSYEVTCELVDRNTLTCPCYDFTRVNI